MLNSKCNQLKGKVAIVTGSGRGMGKAIAEVLASNGAIVIVNDVNLEDAKEVYQNIIEQGQRAIVFQADVCSFDQTVLMVESVLKKYGRIDILVNNAGILRRRNTIEDIDDKEWDLVMNVNVKGVFNCCKAVIGIMKKQKSGKIVNISSSAGRSVSELGGAHYTASKAAVLGLTRHLAREAAPYGINVNAVCPGLIETPMVKESTSEEEIRAQIKAIPMGRLGTPEEVAELVLFLVSDASSYINGAAIDIGGASLLI